MDIVGKIQRTTTITCISASDSEPTIARHFRPSEIEMFQAELNRLCQAMGVEEGRLTAREINERAAEILMRAKSGASRLKTVREN